jgi:hypothetical protein
MRESGATAEQQAPVWKTLGDAIGNGGGLTADTFQKLRDIMPEVARAIASSFNRTDLNAFQKELEKQPKSFQDIEDRRENDKAGD